MQVADLHNVCVQEEQDRLMSLMDTGAALATATGVAGKRSDDPDAVAGLSDGPEGIAREASAAKGSEEAFILSIASCTVHEDRQDPSTLTATPEQQRCLPSHCDAQWQISGSGLLSDIHYRCPERLASTIA